ncbi:MAG: NAD(P)/FAD-dependent oxidoreductase [Desulfobacula sp.]|jgi:protoporphyrinogen oxidase|uniref:NAD(P)/FAD-dependent oxidoreductase n=2 Tax=Desulfobacula sp. TaxID=2593537 RepID=UPI001E0971A3|nr:NAD(P)/FAD-dependent oxidoreductase [Desulfobacula sp.]MBT3803298.1 NAD(P)/FAD-dependent oxidoreductase [Desulfobacula sp.]MBT4023736.1 NAD(P)/FAD-dependent oxidoreductase [Desulfobacula sp.]MBT4197978.1 NAD(P)/FAD-dependent oxidoreductase [Desulfobacula sp.]MBT4505802.1 NAD(P)/FAD-dependent oxidoreductase [Desulfobacula sp.]
MNQKKIIVIGAGPAGLAATYNSAKRKIEAICFEADNMVGGISRTVERNNFRFDIGGHRFFTKIKRVNNIWNEVLGEDFLLRPRLSRIFYNGTFFNYPLQASNALLGLGIFNSIGIGVSYLKSRLFPIHPEDNFEQWVSNRFGFKLYDTFFKTYTEKVWGLDCQQIRAEWAAQRIKGLSLWSAVINALFKNKTAIKTLINEFHYPRLGPGQMYETMAEKAVASGAKLYLNHCVKTLEHKNNRIFAVSVTNMENKISVAGTDFVSTMPITRLITSLSPAPPEKVLNAAGALRYRALLTINLLIDEPQQLPDTWIYVHDPNVKMGRIQCFANWSPHMVPENKSSLGLEYFCWEGDEIWTMSDKDLIQLGKKEIKQLKLIDTDKIFDGFVVRMPKCYPIYDEHYVRHIETIKTYLKQFKNLQLCGRYGLFKYNNMDHSILTALYAVENILSANHNLWNVNADDDYHEEQS